MRHYCKVPSQINC